MEEQFNRLLQRQIKRHFGADWLSPANMKNFLADISESYSSLEEDSRLNQHSLEISSQELREAYLKQKQDADYQKDIILKIKKAIATLNPSQVVKDADDQLSSATSLFESLLDLIEEHKKMEQTLKESEFYLREILNSQEVGVMIIDAETHVISFINQKGASLYGTSHEDIIGKVCHEFICPTICGECSVSNSELDMKSTEKVLLNARGEQIPVLKSVVHSVFNNRKCLVESFVDITIRKQAEEETLKAIEAAQQASIAKSDFLASMSHEIRTPLNGVIGFSDLLRKTSLNDTQQQYVATISQSANSLLEIINDILDFSKIEAGKLELDITQNDLVEISNQVTDMVKFQAHEKNLELLINIPPDMPRFVWVDAGRLRQVLVNILGNAVKFTHQGEIEFKIECKAPGHDGKADYTFSVRDTGVGISPKYQSKIFEAFSQEDTSTTRKYGGTGLGLTISNKLLGLMGSNMRLQSEVGNGSLFYFTLSLKSMHGELEEHGNLDDIRSVLVVDDNQSNRNILKEILAYKHISTTLAQNGNEALGIVSSSEKFDAILMDYNMPELNGIETIKKIHALVNGSLEKASPIILLCSSSDDDKVKEACEIMHIRHRLVKPIKLLQLYHTLSEIKAVSVKTSNEALPLIAPSGPTRACRIMIVEDNPVNMFLAKAIIKEIIPNATIVEAQNGKLAVDKFINASPEFIFMDVQMPVMNGYEATAAIRNLEGGGKVPIVALTAGTVKGEKEKCLSTGMNDYVTKPVVRDTIARVLSEWLQYELNPTPPIEESVKPVEETHDKEPNNKPEIDSGLHSELLALAKMNLISLLPELDEAISNKNLEKIKNIVYKMKGSALSAGFNNLAHQLGQLEDVQTYDHRYVLLIANIIHDEIKFLNSVKN